MTRSRVATRSLVSATLAPLLLIGGWTIAAAVQPASYDATRDTISALAGLAATDRWIMTISIIGLGICHLVTASGLREAATAGRIVLAVGGVATVGVGLTPLPVVGSSSMHAAFAAVSFGCLAAWPFVAGRREPGAAWTLRRPASNTAGFVLSLLVVIFGVSLAYGQLVGATERLAAGTQAIWPLVVAWSVAITSRRSTER